MTFRPNSCEAREKCIEAPGLRNTIHFEVTTPNIGTSDLVLGYPRRSKHNFTYSGCHDHYHFDGYALYQLLDASGTEIKRGRKQAFCLLDGGKVEDYPLSPREGKHTCAYQGVSAGYADTYGVGLDCQFLDITGVPPGKYRLPSSSCADRPASST